MTGGMRRARAHIIGLLASAAALAGLVLAQGTADAAQPNDVIEQRWELLAETATGQLTDADLEVPRGVLPGGTWKFDPQPTASFEVVAKLTGAGSVVNGFEVRLLDSTDAVLASVPFQGQEAPTLTLKTAAFSWPSSDKQLSKIRIVKIGLTPGILDVQKATLKIRQAGTVKKTIGRVPLGTRQTQITHTDWADIADPLIYKHQAADFDPAPTVTLRVTGDQANCGRSRCACMTRPSARRSLAPLCTFRA